MVFYLSLGKFRDTWDTRDGSETDSGSENRTYPTPSQASKTPTRSIRISKSYSDWGACKGGLWRHFSKSHTYPTDYQRIDSLFESK